MKNKSFFKELLNPNSEVSSKRFAGLILLATFAISATVSVFLDLNTNSGDLIKAEGIIGAALLGVNVLESKLKTKPKADEQINK